MEGELTPYYQDDAVTIYHGDCRKVLPRLGMFDLLLTDPPYGIGKSGKKRDPTRKTEYFDYGWDYERPSREVFDLMRGRARNSIIWGGNYFTEYLEPRMGWLVWDKGQDLLMSDCELAFTSFDKALRRIVLNRVEILKDGAAHPTQKPLKLMKWCILQAGEVDTILDPFAGVGTTGRAAKDLGKKAVLIEQVEKYCEIAAKRMMQGVFEFVD